MENATKRRVIRLSRKLATGLSFASWGLMALSAQPLTQQDSTDILEQARLKVMYWEGSLNYLADPIGSSKEVIARATYREGRLKRIFRDGQVELENDLSPLGLQSPPLDSLLAIVDYLKNFQLVYDTEDPNSIQFRVSKIRGIRVSDDGIACEIFFERTMGGTHLPTPNETYPATFHLASLMAEKIDGAWHCYITGIRTATEAEEAYYIPQGYKELMEGQ
ncbi:hypothetical protein [Pontibacter sp. G13]|uniref:hypothetical protein n=1 Tax=Pontibacter sp. G13 TaxID=3074898 RepID=UPI0028898490|nr:hypothetical protein [Pontibacter sp. G13]WNJ20086.1 hypothetical protein RJD25_06340 [Pontibacter sp. G13]